MLVDKMEYQGQQGGGGGQDDAFYELLSSTAMANAKKQQHQQQQQHSQFEQHQAFDSRIEEPVLPSYDFQQSSSSYGGVVSHNSEDKAPAMAPVVSSYTSGPQFQTSRQHLPIPSFVESSPARQERGSNTNSEAATVAAVEQTMKKYMDDLMHMMESMSGRIGQLESSTRRLEQMVTDFKSGSEKNEGAAGGKLLHIETMLSGVQRGIIELCHKQEALEAQVNVGKLHLSEDSIGSAPIRSQASIEPPPPPPQSPRAPQLPESSSYPPHHPHHPPPPPYMVPPQLVGLAPPPPPPPPPAVHTESHYPPSQQGGPPPQQFYGQQQQQQAPPPAPLVHSHGPPAFSHQPELPPFSVPFKGQPVPFGQEVSYRQQQGPPSGSGGSAMYDQSGLLPPYQSQGRPAAPVYEQQRQEQQMGGPPPGYSNASYRTPSAPSSGAGGYPRLPTAQPVHHAMPTARERENAPAAASGATPLSANRLSIDEVIDKVAVMGFSKDQVRAVVKRLTENGQFVDLNIVLDKLMNGEAGQQQKGWFQRG